MVAQPPGRRTESLFDNRYRYDYIFPRGRSGETLRAYDTLDNDRPVVIKRPAPQDAPPMRAGQEVSIRTERQALERLSGHPVLTELRGHGHFRVGGHTHEYIVMDLAVGRVVEEMVLEQASQHRYLPELEVLVIVDKLLDLLVAAHDKQVIYNDVDAKHLFWDRTSYQLKVIDWGNAVFGDEPGALLNVTRGTDIYQCGELLYFILTGGNRLVTEAAESSDTFFVNFGPDAERIPAKLQTILTRAVHPDPKRRYGSMMELRQVLAEYRLPLEKARDEVIARVSKRVRPTASHEELEELALALQVALDMDPGFPKAVALTAEIRFFQRQIAMQADLDAIRIYLESANWPRALSLLNDLLDRADEVNKPLIRFLIAGAALLEDMNVTPPPVGFLKALDVLFAGDAPQAGQVLLMTQEGRPGARQAQWLLAEQLATLMPEVKLIRPHLVRLRYELRELPEAEVVLVALDRCEARLDETPMPGLTGLQVVYEQVAAALDQLEDQVGALVDDHPSGEKERWLEPVIRARRTVHDLLDYLDEVGHYVFGDPSHAGALLRQAAMMDPTSLQFGGLHDYFDEIHQAIQALGQFKPKEDGSNLAGWLADVQEFLQPYLDDLPDKQFHAAAEAIRRAAEGWTTTVNCLALGRRQPTIEALQDTAERIRPFNEHVAAWLGAMAVRLPDASYVELFSPNARMADLLVEGWKAWDRGNGTLAADRGRQAYEQATTDGERLAADRLRRLGDVLEAWLANDNSHVIERIDQAETESLRILLAEEEQERRTFNEQMPNMQLYLRAMNRGIVAYIQQSSSAGWRALYMHYVLRGMLALVGDDLDESEFWRNAAAKTYDDAPTHRAYQVLDRSLTGRRLVQAAEKALNQVSDPQDLESVRHALNAPLAGELLKDAEHAVQDLTQALNDWSDGEFYAARQRLDDALAHMNTAVEVADLRIESFMDWLTHLREVADELQQTRLTIEQGALAVREEPDPDMARAHRQIVTLTLETLGADYAHQVRQWEAMYQSVLDSYAASYVSRQEKLAAFDRHFASLFISKHPAYPLFRHWQAVVEQLPVDEPETSEMAAEAASAGGSEDLLDYLEDDREPEARSHREAGGEGELPWNLIIVAVVLVLVVAGAVAVSRYLNRDKSSAVEGVVVPTEMPAPSVADDATPTSSPLLASQTQPAVATVSTQPVLTPTEPPPTPVPSNTPLPATTIAPTPTTEATEAPPTLTPTLFVTSTLVPQPTIPVADGSDSARDVLAALDRLSPEAYPWSEGVFAPGEEEGWNLSSPGGNGSMVTIELTPQLLSELFQPGVANTLTQATTVLELVAYDEAALANGEVVFGLGAENIGGQRTIGQVQFVEPDLVNLGLNQNGQFRSRTQVPQQNPRVELSVQRTSPTTLSFLIDGKLLGDSVALFAEGDPITLLLVVGGRDVVVEVSTFEIDYSPRAELP